jgi:putative ABC transport system permease protein
MGIIIRFIIRNIIEKKFRTFLILLAITLSAALFFASVALSGTLERAFMQRMKKYFGTAEIVIWPNEKSPNWLFRIHRMESLRERFDYVVGALEVGWTYKNRSETANIDIRGYDLADLQRINPFVLERERALQPFTGPKIIVSRKLAEKYDFRLGQQLELFLGEDRHRFVVAGIAQP